MDLRQLHQFVVLADTLSFRTTAERLSMTTPPLSVSIRKLEDEVGARLFERTTHTVELTRAGRAALESARQALFYAGEFSRLARSAGLGLTGQLQIGFVGSAKYAFLPSMLPLFSEQYPDVTLKLVQNSNSWILEALERREIDIGIVIAAARQDRTCDNLRFELVEQDELSVALPAGHPLAARTSLRLKDIADQPFIRYSANKAPGMHALTMRAFETAGVVPRVVHETLQVQTVILLVENGLGVALVPASAASDTSSRVVFRPLKDKGPHTTVGLELVYDAGRESAPCRMFREAASERFQVLNQARATH
ncbi:DNA-binding transcriptional LysR family regulator [Paraburkholderia sp. BL27I4N3]|uniref:LysR family transcriptional regulator n=1 Tax=Paraburkholderia sp. BL27I4N3 TaxID=1938805 RepID=UPI000E260EDC|nr:LysR family transcriptional regulator [Paraburkholderia sp. BL27I4N3]REE07325.1 DNA-binding transcriptional LysR family regulator [Paraburkholderia sp. BL27I4N3]